MQLNVTKTRELVVDLKRIKSFVTPVYIQGVNLDPVDHDIFEYTLTDYTGLGTPKPFVRKKTKSDYAENVL